MDRGDLEITKCVYRAPGKVFNSRGTQTVFDLILTVRRQGIRRTQQILWVKSFAQLVFAVGFQVLQPWDSLRGSTAAWNRWEPPN